MSKLPTKIKALKAVNSVYDCRIGDIFIYTPAIMVVNGAAFVNTRSDVNNHDLPPSYIEYPADVENNPGCFQAIFEDTPNA